MQLAVTRPGLSVSLTLFGPAPVIPPEREQVIESYGSVFEPTATGSYLIDNWNYLHKLGAVADSGV